MAKVIEVGAVYVTPQGREFTVVVIVAGNVAMRRNKPPYQVSYRPCKEFADLIKAGHYRRVCRGI